MPFNFIESWWHLAYHSIFYNSIWGLSFSVFTVLNKYEFIILTLYEVNKLYNFSLTWEENWVISVKWFAQSAKNVEQLSTRKPSFPLNPFLKEIKFNLSFSWQSGKHF